MSPLLCGIDASGASRDSAVAVKTAVAGQRQAVVSCYVGADSNVCVGGPRMWGDQCGVESWGY